MTCPRQYIPSSVLIIGMFGLLAKAAPPIAPPPRPVDLSALVQELGSPNFRVREAATKRLGNLPLDVPPAELVDALKSSNPEVRRRAAEAVRMLKLHAKERSLGRERLFAKLGQIDRFVIAALAWDVAPDDERLWQTVLDAAVDLSKNGAFKWGKLQGRPSLTTAQFWVTSGKAKISVRSEEDYVLPYRNTGGKPFIGKTGGFRVSTFSAPGILTDSLILSEGHVQAKSQITESVILSNGSVKTTNGFLSRDIIVADGDVEVAYHVGHSIVIARGDIRIRNEAYGSILIAGGRVTIGKTLKFVDQNPELANRVTEHSRYPLGFISFFELSDVGVEVKAAEGGVRVSKLIAKGPMAEAGVREGDIVAKVGEHAVKSAEELRRRLRDASAVKGEAALTIRRGDTTLERRLVIPD